ncbi:hypothetical protein HHI36_017926 [Cryptolaemus montrouzieri]|uniref:Ubiquitin-like protease family profile domain-containing protein n=1 Tax=Cryptolaemus montrouzieri TaxID=559131 RepID=A0ABD2NYG6_9CUCU
MVGEVEEHWALFYINVNKTVIFYHNQKFFPNIEHTYLAVIIAKKSLGILISLKVTSLKAYPKCPNLLSTSKFGHPCREIWELNSICTIVLYYTTMHFLMEYSKKFRLACPATSSLRSETKTREFVYANMK